MLLICPYFYFTIYNTRWILVLNSWSVIMDYNKYLSLTNFHSIGESDYYEQFLATFIYIWTYESKNCNLKIYAIILLNRTVETPFHYLFFQLLDKFFNPKPTILLNCNYVCTIFKPKDLRWQNLQYCISRIFWLLEFNSYFNKPY